jgi:molybdopterin-guanine dinucleotide biosynthesis protein B
VDIILTEGFKEDKQPKIEVFRSSVHEAPLCTEDENLIAMVTDDDVDIHTVIFGLDEVQKLANFVVNMFSLSKP